MVGVTPSKGFVRTSSKDFKGLRTNVSKAVAKDFIKRFSVLMTRYQTAAKRRTYTVQEAAQLLGISRGVAYAAVHRGEIPSIKIGTRYVIPKDRLEEMLAGKGAEEQGAETGLAT